MGKEHMTQEEHQELLTERIGNMSRKAKEAAKEAERWVAERDLLVRQAKGHMTVRQIAAITGLSHQRVQQILDGSGPDVGDWKPSWWEVVARIRVSQMTDPEEARQALEDNLPSGSIVRIQGAMPSRTVTIEIHPDTDTEEQAREYAERQIVNALEAAGFAGQWQYRGAPWVVPSELPPADDEAARR